MSRQTEAELLDLLRSDQVDPAEQKRLRGVLAQRRYRRRKRYMGMQSNMSGGSIFPEHSTEFNPLLSSWNFEDVEPLEDSMFVLPLTTDPDDSYTRSLNIAGHDLPTSELSFMEAQVAQPAIVESDSFMYQQTNAAFGDEHSISMPQLGTLKAHLSILETLFTSLGLAFQVDSIWNTFAKSPFQGCTQLFEPNESLPAHLLPTTAQLNIPHHPVFDILPWPSVRDKILYILSLPVHHRPKSVQDSLENVVLTFKFDAMDATEGMRIHGLNAFDSHSWEIGQRMFEHWWWALDSDIISHSNNLRERRGAPKLRLKEID